MKQITKFLALLYLFLVPTDPDVIIRPYYLHGIHINYLDTRIRFKTIVAILLITAALYETLEHVITSLKTDSTKASATKNLRIITRHPQLLVPLRFIILAISAATIGLYCLRDNLVFIKALDLLGFFVGLPLTFILLSNNPKAIYAILFSSFVQAFLSILQLFFKTAYSHSFLFDIAVKLGQSPALHVKVLASEFLSRAYGTTAHPNILGFAMTVYLAFLVSNCPKKRNSLLCLLALSSVLLTLILTLSKTAILAAVLLFIYTVLQKRLKKILLVSALLFGAVFPWLSVKFFRSENLPYFISLRVASYKLVIDKLKVFGHGFLSFFRTYTAEPPHNIFLLVLYELGLPGLVLLAIYTLLLPKQKHGLDMLALVFLVAMTFDHYLYY